MTVLLAFNCEIFAFVTKRLEILALDTFNKDTFERELYNMCSTHEPQNTRIILPSILTKSERHSLHLLTCNGFNPESFGFEPQRYMVLNITKKFIESLNEKFKDLNGGEFEINLIKIGDIFEGAIIDKQTGDIQIIVRDKDRKEAENQLIQAREYIKAAAAGAVDDVHLIADYHAAEAASGCSKEGGGLIPCCAKQ